MIEAGQARKRTDVTQTIEPKAGHSGVHLTIRSFANRHPASPDPARTIVVR